MADACRHPEAEARREWAERWLSQSRFSSYLELCNDDVNKALELHEWNLVLGRALMGDIAHFELTLRNAYDRVLTERFEGSEHWLFDANSPVKIDADMLALFQALSPEAHDSIYGSSKKTTVEKFLEDHPAPIDVEL